MFSGLSRPIVTGAGQFLLGISGSLVVGIMLLIFTDRTVREIPYLFVVNCRDAEAERELWRA